MSRPLRLEFAGALYHVSARGNAREDIFRDDRDRATFLDLLGREIAQQRWRLYAYCLLGRPRAPRWLQGDRAQRGLPPIRCAGHRPALGVGSTARADVARR
jgi:hypothetical protein